MAEPYHEPETGTLERPARIRRSVSRLTWTPIDNATIEDRRLSFKALGLLVYLLSKPAHWEVNVRELSKSHTEGDYAVRQGLDELESGGYAQRLRDPVDDRGHWRYTYVVSERPDGDPNRENRETGSEPFRDFRDAETRIAETAPLIKTESEVTTESPTSPTSNAAASDDARRLADLLADLIVANGATRRPNVTATWVTDMDRLIRLDGHTAEQVERAIRWCQADPFWQANIMSPRKLREKYETLRLRAKEKLREHGRDAGTRALIDELRDGTG